MTHVDKEAFGPWAIVTGASSGFDLPIKLMAVEQCVAEGARRAQGQSGDPYRWPEESDHGHPDLGLGRAEDDGHHVSQGTPELAATGRSGKLAERGRLFPLPHQRCFPRLDTIKESRS
jgi:hypothetical protein